MADVGQTKYQFSNSYSGAPTGIFNGAAGGYHFLGGWNAETDRRASKRAEGLQMFKDYVKTLTDNGIVPNEQSLNSFIGQAGDFGLNASYGFDPYAAQQMMQSAIKQGENKKKEIAEKQIQEEAKTNKSFSETYNLSRGNYRTMEETMAALKERFPDLPPERFAALGISSEDEWNKNTIESLAVTTKGIYDLNYIDDWKKSHPNASEQQERVLTQSIESNRSDYAKKLADTLDPSIAQGKTDEELRKIVIPKMDANLRNDEQLISTVVKTLKGNAISEAAKATNAVRTDMAGNTAKLVEQGIKHQEKIEAAQDAAKKAAEQNFLLNKNNREVAKANIDKLIANKKLKGKQLLSAKADKLLIDYKVDKEIERKIRNAESYDEMMKILEENKNRVFNLDEILACDLQDIQYTNPTSTISGYKTNKSVDYMTFANNNLKFASILVSNNLEGVEKDRDDKRSYNNKLSAIGETLAIRLQTVRDGLFNGGGHNYSPQELLQLERRYVEQFLNDPRLNEQDKQFIFKDITSRLGEAPNILKKPSPREEYFGWLRDITGTNNPVVHNTSYFNQGGVTPTQVISAQTQTAEIKPSVKQQWAAFSGASPEVLSQPQQTAQTTTPVTSTPTTTEPIASAPSQIQQPQQNSENWEEAIYGDDWMNVLQQRAVKTQSELAAQKAKEAEEARQLIVDLNEYRKEFPDALYDSSLNPQYYDAETGEYVGGANSQSHFQQWREAKRKEREAAKAKKEEPPKKESPKAETQLAKEKGVVQKVIESAVPEVSAREIDERNPNLAQYGTILHERGTELRDGVMYDGATGKPTNTPYVATMKQYPVSFFNQMRYDDPRLNKVATHIGVQYGLPYGVLNGIKNAGERSNNWEMPDFKKTNSTAKGVFQMTDTTRKTGKTIHGSLEHNPFNAVENTEAAAKLISSEYLRLRKAIPIWDDKCNPLVATLIQYCSGTSDTNKYIKEKSLKHLKPHDLAYIKRVLLYMQENAGKEREEYIRDLESGFPTDSWEVAANF